MDEGIELTIDGAASVIQDAWTKAENVTVRDLWVDSEGIANVRAEWEVEGIKLAHNLRMAVRSGSISII